MGQEDLHQSLARVERLAGQQPIERAAQGIDVRPVIGRVGVLGLLGGHVVAGAHHLAAGGEAVRSGGRSFQRRVDAGQPHVENLHRAVAVQKQIGGLDVAVNDALLVRVLQPPGRLHHTIDRLPHRQRALRLDDLAQIVAVDVLHHEKVDALGLARVVGGDDVGMLQPGRGPNLAAEPADRVGRLHRLRRQDLQGHDPLHRAVAGLEDLPHPARADLFQHGVFAEDQPAGFAPVDGRGLEAGEHLGGDQLPGQRLGVAVAAIRRQPILKRGDLAGRQDAAADQVLDELLERDGHAPTPSG